MHRPAYSKIAKNGLALRLGAGKAFNHFGRLAPRAPARTDSPFISSTVSLLSLYGQQESIMKPLKAKGLSEGLRSGSAPGAMDTALKATHEWTTLSLSDLRVSNLN